MNKRSSLSRHRFTLLLFSCVLIICALAFPLISQGVDMFGWFKKQEVFLSSEVKGVVTENGKAVANLEITRSLMYIDGKDHLDIAITDSTGHFTFPRKSIRSSIPSKPFSEDRVSQQITVEHKGVLLPLWIATNYGIKETLEFTKKLSFLNCELSSKRVSFQFRNNNPNNLEHTASSICRWDNDYIPFLLYDGDNQYIVEDGNFNTLTDRFTGKEVKL